MRMQQLLFWLPAGVGGLITVLLVGVVLWPQWQQVRLGGNRTSELRDLQSQLPLLTQQLQREQDGVINAQHQQSVVLQLIAGSGSLATFLAQVDRLAASSGVQLALFEPLVSQVQVPDPKAKPTPAEKDTGKDQPAVAPDLLLAPGLIKQEVLMRATGGYPALLAFMRQLERLNVLVVQSNLQLTLEEAKDKSKVPAVLPVILKMSLATYSKKEPG